MITSMLFTLNEHSSIYYSYDHILFLAKKVLWNQSKNQIVVIVGWKSCSSNSTPFYFFKFCLQFILKISNYLDALPYEKLHVI